MPAFQCLADEGAGDELTPRELERSVGAQMPETRRRWLDAAVTTFELANYSVHDIRRADLSECMCRKRGYVSDLQVQTTIMKDDEGVSKKPPLIDRLRPP